MKKRNEGERYYIVIESSGGNKISKGESTELSARVFVKGAGVDITEELKKKKIEVRWKRTTAGGRDRSGQTDSEWNENKRGFSCVVRYEETNEKSRFSAEIAEQVITDALLPSNRPPGGYVFSHYGSLLTFSTLVKGDFEIIDDTTNLLRSETLQNKRDVLLNQISLEVNTLEGSMIFKNNQGSVTLEARIKFREQDITDEMRLLGITFEWTRQNPAGVDENGRTDAEWIEAHRGLFQVTFTAADNVKRATVGCRILNPEIITNWLEENHLTNL